MKKNKLLPTLLVFTKTTMRILKTISLALLILTGCKHSYKSELIKSHSAKYMINATINQTNKNTSDFAYVIIHVYTSDKKEIKVFNTKAGDFNKWALGWTNTGDTIVFLSSDIGNKAWSIRNDNLSELTMTDKLTKRAEELYSFKYKK